MFDLKNVLVQYQGGGYDGCYWEYNYFLIDGRGEFVNIASSGSAGIETEEEAKDLLANDDATKFVYDLMDEKDIDEFSKEVARPHVFGVLKWFGANPQNGIRFYARCSECGEKRYSADEVCLEDWHGCGGLASTADKLLCSACLALGTCDCCNAYVGEEDIIALYQIEPESDLARNNEYYLKAARSLIYDCFTYVCRYCLDNAARQIEEDEREDLRWASFTTGKPDLFSDEMRWFHNA